MIVSIGERPACLALSLARIAFSVAQLTEYKHAVDLLTGLFL